MTCYGTSIMNPVKLLRAENAKINMDKYFYLWSGSFQDKLIFSYT